MNDGGPAFPRFCEDAWGKPFVTGGMSLRDYFAAAAMQGILASRPDYEKFAHLATDAYAIADAMLKERYASYDSGFGKQIEDRKVSMKDCEEWIHKNGEAKRFSGQQELYEVLLNKYS